MKKIKFLNGMSAVFALAVVALATTFTSCEKEEFNVKVEPINAQATISPIVLAVENGVTKDVTGDAAITYDPASTFTGSPSFAGATVTIGVTYKDMSTSVKVIVPALQAGQFASLTPTIILQKEAPETKIEMNETATTQEVSKDGNKEVPNPTDYLVTTTVKYTKKSGNLVLEDSKVINTTDFSERMLAESFFSTLKNTYEETPAVEEGVKVYAHSQTEAKVVYTVVTTEYKIVKTADANTKAGEEVLASIKTQNYTKTDLQIKDNQPIPGHNHAPQGHGHGHGHGDDGNAGGGIVIAD